MKEILFRRLIGAGVLLVLAFAVASFLPSPGPGASLVEQQAQLGESRVVTYELRGSRPVGLQLDAELETPQGTNQPSRRTRKPNPPVAPSTLVADAVISDKAADSADKAPAKSTPEPKAAPKPEPTPKANPEPTPEPEFSSNGQRWSVQVASFADPENARKTRDRLKAKKLRAHVQEVHVGNAVWFRVRVGPFPKESDASKALDQVKKLEFRGARLIEE